MISDGSILFYPKNAICINGGTSKTLNSDFGEVSDPSLKMMKMRAIIGFVNNKCNRAQHIVK